MHIFKLGHCCLRIDVDGIVFLTDPGSYTINGQQDQVGIDAVLITHEHADHLHLDSLVALLQKNPAAKVFTNTSVGKLLAERKIAFECVEDGQKVEIKGVVVEGIGTDHAVIHTELPVAQNTGFLINERLFYPGDALTDPKRHVDILALPVAGPWIKISEAIDYAIRLKPMQCFPVHDGFLSLPGPFHRVPGMILKNHGIEFIALESGQDAAF